jgi:hypothetical protein
MLATNKTVMIVTRRNQIFEYIAPNVEEALNKYIREVLIASNIFTINEDAWNILVSTLPAEPQDDVHPMSIRTEIINGLCKRHRYKIAKIVTGHYEAYPDYIGTDSGVIYKIPAGKNYAEVIGYSGTSTKINIVTKFNGMPVTHIAAGAFRQVNLLEINIPSNVAYVGANAFLDCVNLEKIIYCNDLANWDSIEIESEGNECFTKITPSVHEMAGDGKCSLCSHEHTAGQALNENVVSATCEAVGSYDSVVRCLDCGEEMSRDANTVPALGHSMSEATCTAPKTCSVCGATEGEALGHSYERVVTAPTCTTTGFTTYTCSCGDSYIADKVAALGHSYKDATCTAPATCSVCGTSTGSKLGHSYRYTKNVNPTTSSTGSIKGTCSRCGGTTTVTLPKLTTSNYTRTQTKAPTCTAKGTWTWTWNTKTYGTFTFTSSIPALGGDHEYSFTAGSGYCTICGAACTHSWNSETVAAQSCIKTGTKRNTCTICGAIQYEDIPATGHSFKNGECTICGALKPTQDYYLVGFINGKGYESETAQYKFVNGKLTASFDSDSTVKIWASGEKMTYTPDPAYHDINDNNTKLYAYNKIVDHGTIHIPGDTIVTFTLVVNSDGSLTMWYNI